MKTSKLELILGGGDHRLKSSTHLCITLQIRKLKKDPVLNTQKEGLSRTDNNKSVITRKECVARVCEFSLPSL